MQRGFSGTALAGGNSVTRPEAVGAPAPGAEVEAAAAAYDAAATDQAAAAAAGPAADCGSGLQQNGGGGGGGGGLVTAAAMQTEPREQLSGEELPPDLAAAEHQAGLDGMSAEDRAAVMAAMMS